VCPTQMGSCFSFCVDSVQVRRTWRRSHASGPRCDHMPRTRCKIPPRTPCFQGFQQLVGRWSLTASPQLLAVLERWA